MTTPIPVSLAGDGTSGVTLHAFAPPDLYESSTPMEWPPGGAMASHKLAASVRHKGQAISQEGHDLGPLLNHVPGLHPTEVLTLLKSSRKAIFSCASVRAAGAAVACVDLNQMVPMLLCGEPVSVPGGSNDTNSIHSVFVGMTTADKWVGWIRCGAVMATDAIMAIVAVLGGGGGVGDVVSDVLGFDPAKIATSSVVGIAESIGVSYVSGWQEPIVWKATAGPSGRTVSWGFSYHPKNERITFDVSANDAPIDVDVRVGVDGVRLKGGSGGAEREYVWGSPL